MDYHNAAEDFAAKHGLTLNIVEALARCPGWTNGNTAPKMAQNCPYGSCHSTHGKHYVVGVTWAPKNGARARQIAFDYWGSFADSRNGVHPSVYDVLSCLASDAQSSTSLDEIYTDLGPMPPSQCRAIADGARRARKIFTPGMLRVWSAEVEA